MTQRDFLTKPYLFYYTLNDAAGSNGTVAMSSANELVAYVLGSLLSTGSNPEQVFKGPLFSLSNL